MVPASIRTLKNGDVRLRCVGPPVTESVQKEHRTVWDLIDSWGANWMWELISEEDRERDVSWRREGIAGGTLVWCCDGSYKKKVVPTASGTGWIVYCTKTGNMLKGYFLRYQRTQGRTEGSSWGCVQCII